MTTDIAVTYDKWDRPQLRGADWELRFHGYEDVLDDEDYDISRNAGRVYVDDDYLNARHPENVTLSKEAFALNRARDFPARGLDPEVDTAFDALNNRIRSFSLAAVREVFAQLTDYIPDAEQIAANARYSINAGCGICPCSPGVILGGRLTLTLPEDPHGVGGRLWGAWLARPGKD